MGSNASAVRTPYAAPLKVSFSLILSYSSLHFYQICNVPLFTFSKSPYLNVLFFTNISLGIYCISLYSGWSVSLNLAVMRSEDIWFLQGKDSSLMAATSENEAKTL